MTIFQIVGTVMIAMSLADAWFRYTRLLPKYDRSWIVPSIVWDGLAVYMVFWL